MSEALFELTGAQVVRDGRTILSVDSLRVNAGEHLAILGPNGAGKSTLIGLLSRDVLPVWGDPPPVRFLDKERIELAEARRMLGVVSSVWQEVVDVHLTVREIVLGGRFGTLGVPPHLRGAVSDEDAHATEKAMREAGIEPLADRDMRTLSTGEARRALVARSLVHDPLVLVLDEPCAGLDPTAAYHLRDLMRDLASRNDRTLVLVTHHVEDIVRGIGRVVMLREGRVVGDGPTSDLLTANHLSALYGVPLDVDERNGEYRLW